MPALGDDASQNGAGQRDVAKFFLDDRERLPVLRAGRRRQDALRQERVDRRGQVDTGVPLAVRTMVSRKVGHCFNVTAGPVARVRIRSAIVDRSDGHCTSARCANNA
jgi:hypothetical protein